MKESNKKALQATKAQHCVPAPRLVVESSLLTTKNNMDLKDLPEASISEELLKEIAEGKKNIRVDRDNRKIFSFTEKFAYAQDIIFNCISKYPSVIKTEGTSYYSFELSRDGIQILGAGDHKELYSDVIDKINDLVENPCSKAMKTTVTLDNGKTLDILESGQPIIIKRTSVIVTNKKNSFVTNLKTGTDKDIPQTAFSKYEVLFLKSQYFDVVENGINFIKLPECLFAKLKSYMDKNGVRILTKAEREYFGYLKTKDGNDREIEKWEVRNPLSPLECYKAIMYFSKCDPYDYRKGYKTQNEYKSWEIDAIDFISSVTPTNAKKETKHKKTSEGITINYDTIEVNKYFEVKLLCDIWSRIYTDLYKRGEIQGMKFTSCSAYVDKQRKKIIMKVERPAQKKMLESQ